MTRRLAAVAALTMLLAGCGGGGRPNEATRTDTAPAPVPAATKGRPLAAADIKLTIKVTSKECFGESGCGISYRVRAAWPAGVVPADAAYEVTYRVVGPTDGPQIGTMTVRGDSTYDTPDEYATTPRESTVLKPTVIEVERVP